MAAHGPHQYRNCVTLFRCVLVAEPFCGEATPGEKVQAVVGQLDLMCGEAK